MDFVTSVKRAFANYANFEGRATRPEYWWFYLFTLIVGVVLNIVDGGGRNPLVFVSGLVSLAMVCPSVAVATRRLHDTDKSGWRQLWALTVVGVIPLIFWLAQPSQSGANKYGPGATIDTDVFS